MLSSTMRTLIGGITPNAELLLSFSDLYFTRGTTRGGRGDSVRSTMGEGGDCVVLGAVMLGKTPPVLRVLLLRRVVGEVFGTTFPAATPLADECPGPGDLGEVVCGVGFSTDTAGGAVGVLVMIGQAPDPEERRCCDEAMGGPPSGEPIF